MPGLILLAASADGFVIAKEGCGAWSSKQPHDPIQQRVECVRVDEKIHEAPERGEDQQKIPRMRDSLPGFGHSAE